MKNGNGGRPCGRRRVTSLGWAPSRGGVKLNFFKGASLPDPQNLFNAGLDAKASRAIDFAKGSRVNEKALRDLVRAAVAENAGKS